MIYSWKAFGPSELSDHPDRQYLLTTQFHPPFFSWIISNVAPQMMRAVCVRKVRLLPSQCPKSSFSHLPPHFHHICSHFVNGAFSRATAFRSSVPMITLVSDITKIVFPAGSRSYVESVARSAVPGGDQPTSAWSPSPPEETTGPQKSTSPTSYSLNPPLSSSSPIQSSQW